jgi:antitoxin (DNA-binding transcriptional repressor) of toxin-antitoxin stability system
MPTDNVHAAKTHLSRLVDQAAAGEEVIIARAGKPVARLVALPPPEPARQPLVLGLLAGQMTIPDNFHDPLPDDLLDGFERVLMTRPA